MNGSANFTDSTFRYVSGVTRGGYEGCSAVLRPGERPTLVVSALEEESARTAPDSDVTAFQNLALVCNPQLDVTNRFQVLIESLLVDDSQVTPQVRDTFTCRIQDAAIQGQTLPRRPQLRFVGWRKEPLEDCAVICRSRYVDSALVPRKRACPHSVGPRK